MKSPGFARAFVYLGPIHLLTIIGRGVTVSFGLVWKAVPRDVAKESHKMSARIGFADGVVQRMELGSRQSGRRSHREREVFMRARTLSLLFVCLAAFVAVSLLLPPQTAAG